MIGILLVLDRTFRAIQDGVPPHEVYERILALNLNAIERAACKGWLLRLNRAWIEMDKVQGLLPPTKAFWTEYYPALLKHCLC